MDQKELRELESLCIQDEAPWCTAACPVHVDVRAMMGHMGANDLKAAYGVLAKAVVFPNIIGRICHHPCEDRCKRIEIDDALSIGELERYCTRNVKVVPKPPRIARKLEIQVAVIGAGLGGLVAASELARKGYQVTVYEPGPVPWSDLFGISQSLLPKDILVQEMEAIASLGVRIVYNVKVSSVDDVLGYLGEHAAVFVSLPIAGLGSGDVTTLATDIPGVFAPVDSSQLPIESVATGKRAAISMDRHVQGVSLGAGREKEGPYETRLYTNIEGVKPVARVLPQDEEAGYTPDEAVEEASRCLLCECMECVKACEYLRAFGGYPKRYLREIYNNEAIVMGQRKANTLINSCSLCGLCGQVCPNGLDMGVVVKKAREGMVARGKMPPSPHDFPMRDMEFSGSDRFAMAKHAPGTVTSDYLFFPGCQLCATMPEHVESAYDYLRQKLGRVGLILGCCGAPADWVGQTEAFLDLRAKFLHTLDVLGKPPLILACSSCLDIFKTHYPGIEVISLWEVYDLHGIPQDHLLVPPEPIAIHDACSTRNDGPRQDAVRNLLSKMDVPYEELDHGRDKTTCCGFGGLMTFANPEVTKKVIDKRIGESDHPFLVYCAMCKDRFTWRDKETYHILDLIYGGAQGPPIRDNVGFSQKRENRARLKEKMLRELWGEYMDGEAQPRYQIHIDDDARQKMELRLILEEDIQKVIHHAETTGKRLLDRKTGRYLAYYRPTAVTYWVEYTVAGDVYHIHNAYSHRMEIGEG